MNHFAVQVHTYEALTFQPLARFWSQGVGGLPETYLFAYDFGRLTMAPGETRWLEATISGFSLPSGVLWAGMQFRLSPPLPSGIPGVEIANPASIATSNDYFFFSDASGDLAGVDNPSAGLYWFGGEPVANFAWEIEAVPEAGTAAFLVTGLFALACARRLHSRKRHS